MTVIDRENTSRNVLMILPKRTILKEVELPQGYRYVPYTDAKKEELASLMCSLNLFDSASDAIKTIDFNMSKNRQFYKEEAICVVDDLNRLVGFASLNKDDTFSKDQICIQWFGVKEENQRNGIGKAMITKLSLQFDQLKTRFPLYIRMNSNAYVAIAMLARMGFNPFMGEYENQSEEQSKEDWEFVTNLLKEKTKQGKL